MSVHTFLLPIWPSLGGVESWGDTVTLRVSGINMGRRKIEKDIVAVGWLVVLLKVACLS